MGHHFYLTKPAADWQMGFPVGNGRLGMTQQGGVDEENLLINEESLWYGEWRGRENPQGSEALGEIRRLLREGAAEEAQRLARMNLTGIPKYINPYQPAGEVRLAFWYGRKKGEVSCYRRELDLDKALSSVEYFAGETFFRRECFADLFSNTICIHLSCSRQELSFQMNLNRRPFEERGGRTAEGILYLAGGTGIRYVLAAQIGKTDGKVSEAGDIAAVDGASSAVIYVTAATDYEGGDPMEKCKNNLKRAGSLTYEEKKLKHEKEYRSLYNKMSLSLNMDERRQELPADELLRKGSTAELSELLFAYGRYLLLSSSYYCALPANLQGIWNGSFTPPWECAYTININLQMNYWMAARAGLSECISPLVNLAEKMLPNGRRTAKLLYGCRGFVAHHNTNLWGDTAIDGLWSSACIWPMGGAWLAAQLYDIYLYNEEEELLEETVLPMLMETVEFFYDYLERREDGRWLTGPSVSPENTYRTADGQEAAVTMGPSMDCQILREAAGDYLEAVKRKLATEKITEREQDAACKAAGILEHVPGIRLGRDGRILEWEEEYEETEPGHRHISQLYGLYPGHEISPGNQELSEGARKTLEYRLEHGGGHTGWSRIWIMCFYARLFDGEAFGEHLRLFLKKSVADNLWDMHPPFQIDGNFGFCAALMEALVIEEGEMLYMLPALPIQWHQGAVSGLCLKGRLSINFNWEQGQVKRIEFFPKKSRRLMVHANGSEREVQLEAFQEYCLIL
ncbi:glycosyl hydrolase family 95 catalytic domain-containing protein [Murimonas intestini]|uniref:glycoside hydrolase family 95 protein n=1 Tax=Murimonas intestini TaxID=1337051 RepID=UPI0011DDE27F|nr:glycoside hydrolase family 95 protein [Murimonas intestini]